MCRLFGFRSNVPSRAHRSLLEAENALSVQAANHSDGWGIGYFLGEDAYILKSETGAASDERFQRISRRLTSHAFVVHVRRATVGQPDHLNSHPFRHGAWVFAHNGTLFDFDRLRPRMLARTEPDLAGLIFGSTDSEHLFYYLLSALSRVGVPDHGRGVVDADLTARALRGALGDLFLWAKEHGSPPPIANFILTNGRVFIAQRAGLELFLASQKIHCKDFETCPEPDKVCMEVLPPLDLLWDQRPSESHWRKVNHAIVASEPIGEEDIWEEIPEGLMLLVDEQMRLHVHPAPDHFQRCPSPPAPAPRPHMGHTLGLPIR